MAFRQNLRGAAQNAAANAVSGAVAGGVSHFTGGQQQAPSDGSRAATINAPNLGEASLKGNRKAVLVGINYRGQSGELRGCINDVLIMQKGLMSYGFQQENMQVLTEDMPSNMHPTRSNITKSIKWLIQGAKSGDTLFFHYSGHGTRVKDVDGDEDDGYDEAICPLDYSKAGLMLDDELFSTMVKPLPKGCRLTSLMDCCHSGSALDLPYSFIVTEEATRKWRLSGILPSMNLISRFTDAIGSAVGQRAPVIGGAILDGAARGGASRSARAGGSSGTGQQVSQKQADCEAILFSGCMDTQTSADVSDISKFQLPPGFSGAGGACTSAFVESLARNKNICYIALLEEMRTNLAGKRFTQVPQLSSSCNVPLDAPFRLVA